MTELGAILLFGAVIAISFAWGWYAKGLTLPTGNTVTNTADFPVMASVNGQLVTIYPGETLTVDHKGRRVET